MGNREYLKSIGKNMTYFHVIKHQRSMLYRYIYMIGRGDLVKGHRKYLELTFDLKDELIELIYKIGEDKFAAMIHKRGIYTSKDNALIFLNKAYRSDTNIDTFRKIKKVLKEFS